VDGRPAIGLDVGEADPDVRRYIQVAFRGLLATRAFLDALPGFLLPDAASQIRLGLLLERLRMLATSRRNLAGLLVPPKRGARRRKDPRPPAFARRASARPQ
jgi:hypothetical protein